MFYDFLKWLLKQKMIVSYEWIKEQYSNFLAMFERSSKTLVYYH